MEQVNAEVLKAIEENQTMRIIFDVPTEILRADEYITSASEFIDPFRRTWQTKHLTRFLVVDVYPRHAYIVIDINNHECNFDVAHKQTSPFPVYILRLTRRSQKWIFFRRAVDDKRIARRLAELHCWNDQNPIPFFSDHIRGSVYYSHREGCDCLTCSVRGSNQVVVCSSVET